MRTFPLWLVCTKKKIPLQLAWLASRDLKIKRPWASVHHRLTDSFEGRRQEMKTRELFEKSKLQAQGYKETQPWFELPQDTGLDREF